MILMIIIIIKNDDNIRDININLINKKDKIRQILKRWIVCTAKLFTIYLLELA